jgi:hypothetical protein
MWKRAKYRDKCHFQKIIPSNTVVVIMLRHGMISITIIDQMTKQTTFSNSSSKSVRIIYDITNELMMCQVTK